MISNGVKSGKITYTGIIWDNSKISIQFLPNLQHPSIPVARLLNYSNILTQQPSQWYEKRCIGFIC